MTSCLDSRISGRKTTNPEDDRVDQNAATGPLP